jgi:hypothetical protein
MGGWLMDKIFTKPRVVAISACVSKNRLELSDLADLYGEETVAKIMKVTGIRRVSVAPKGTTTADYCTAAAKYLMQEQNIDPQTIDGLVFVTETPDYIIPHTSAILQERLGLPNRALAFDINYGCAGYVYGIFQASLLIESGYCRRVLLCAGDTLSHYVNPADKAVRMVLGDGGSATLVEADENGRNSAFSFYTDGSRAENLMIPAGASRMPREPGVTDVLHTDADGNARTDEDFYMNGLEVMGFALNETLASIRETAERMKWELSEVELLALHQANALIVQYITKQLKLLKERAPIAVGDTGNASSASIPIMLTSTFGGKTLDFTKVLACGFGTGLSCAGGALDLSGTQVFGLMEE